MRARDRTFLFLVARSRATTTTGLPESIAPSPRGGVLRVRVAKGFLDRALGLLGRVDLPPGEGLLLAPCDCIHTFFMRFAIDVVFLDAHGEVIAIHARVPAWRILHRAGATGVLELAAGAAGDAGLRVGDLLPQLAGWGLRR